MAVFRRPVNRDAVWDGGIDRARLHLAQILTVPARNFKSHFPQPTPIHALCPHPAALSLKGLRSGEREGIITPLQGNFNTPFCVFNCTPLRPPFDEHIGSIPQLVCYPVGGVLALGTWFLCVFCVCSRMITLPGRNRQHCLFNSVIDATGIEGGSGEKTRSLQSGKQSVAGKLQISTKLSGPLQKL